MLATFPRGTPLAILAPVHYGYGEILAKRRDPSAIRMDPVAASAQSSALIARGNILLEGLDGFVDPAEFLRKLAKAAPNARLFALVSNAAHLRGLADFLNGAPLAAAHPLVREELEPLFASGGWRVIEINAIYDEAVAVSEPLPLPVEMRGIRFSLPDEPMRARGRVYAFLTVADAS